MRNASATSSGSVSSAAIDGVTEVLHHREADADDRPVDRAGEHRGEVRAGRQEQEHHPGDLGQFLGRRRDDRRTPDARELGRDQPPQQVVHAVAGAGADQHRDRRPPEQRQRDQPPGPVTQPVEVPDQQQAEGGVPGDQGHADQHRTRRVPAEEQPAQQGDRGGDPGDGEQQPEARGAHRRPRPAHRAATGSMSMLVTAAQTGAGRSAQLATWVTSTTTPIDRAVSTA